MRVRTRRLLGAAAALMAVVTVAACGGSDEGGDDGASTSGATEVTTKFGAIEVPANPSRIVALGWGDAETALALGAQPIGASDWLGFGGEGVGPWADGMYEKAPALIATLVPDYEAIAKLKPDLILDTKGSGEAKRYERLASIAPTVGVPEGGDNYLTTAQQQTTMIAQALGQAEKGKELLAGVDKKLADAAAANARFEGKTFTVSSRTADGWAAYVEGTERVEFMEKLGFTLAPAIADAQTKEFSLPIATEELDKLDADVSVTFPIFVEASVIEGDAAWKALPSVKAGHGVVLSDPNIVNAFSLGTTMATEYAVDQVVPLLQKAVPAS